MTKQFLVGRCGALWAALTLSTFIGLSNIDAAGAQSGDASLDAAKRVFGEKAAESNTTPGSPPAKSTAPEDGIVASPMPTPAPAPSPGNLNNGLSAKVDEVVRNPEDLDDIAKSLLIKQALQKIEEIAQSGLKGYDRQELLKRLQVDLADVDKNVHGAPAESGQSAK